MKFWMSGEVDADVADDYRCLRQDIEGRLNSNLSSVNVGVSVEEVAFIPVITSIAKGLYPEVMKFNKRQKEAEFRPVIDHAEFKSASAYVRREMLLGRLEKCVRSLPTLGVNDVDVNQIIECIYRIQEK